jgi:hypothetical protein
VQEDVPVVSEWVATLDGYVNAQIQAQVAGYVVAQKYKEGSLVRKPFRLGCSASQVREAWTRAIETLASIVQVVVPADSDRRYAI